jgi:hypothetical protein
VRTLLSLVATISLAAAVADGAIVARTSHGDANLVGLEQSIAAGDLLSGLIATEQPGDLGWHPVNNAAQDRLPAFTDDHGPGGHAYYGLLNDACIGGDCTPGYDKPVKLVRYTLDAPKNIHEFRIFTGNLNDADGRIFSTTLIKFSVDGGLNFQDFGYFQSDPSGTQNSPSVGNYHSTLVWIFDDLAQPLLEHVTDIEFDFYAVHNNDNQAHDPFNGTNPFTNVDDGLTPPFTSPLVWEIDALGIPNEVCDNGLDDDGDERVDCDDPDCVGTIACFCHRPFADADGDADVDRADFGAWQACFTGFGFGPVPQPPSYCYCFDRLKDNDVDQDDMVLFLNCFSGPGVPASLNCGQ